MTTKKEIAFLEQFKTLEDPRIDRKKLHPLDEILLVVLCGTICYAESWRDLVDFAEERLDLLKCYLPFKHGIPSKNTYSRVMAALDPDAFQSCFRNWAQILDY